MAKNIKKLNIENKLKTYENCEDLWSHHTWGNLEDTNADEELLKQSKTQTKASNFTTYAVDLALQCHLVISSWRNR